MKIQNIPNNPIVNRYANKLQFSKTNNIQFDGKRRLHKTLSHISEKKYTVQQKAEKKYEDELKTRNMPKDILELNILPYARETKTISERMLKHILNEENKLEIKAESIFGKNLSLVKYIVENIEDNNLTIMSNRIENKFKISRMGNETTINVPYDNISLSYFEGPEKTIRISSGNKELVYTYNSDDKLNLKTYNIGCKRDNTGFSAEYSLQTRVNTHGEKYNVLRKKYVQDYIKQTFTSDNTIEFLNFKLVNYNEKPDSNNYETCYNYNRNNGELVLGYITNPEKNIKLTYYKDRNTIILGDGHLRYLYNPSRWIPQKN